MYGPQESDELEERKDFYDKVSIEIEKAQNVGDRVMIIGDMNAKLDHDTEGQIVPESGNGKFLVDTVTEYDLDVVNLSDRCRGKWTWSKNILGVNHRSRLDYLIVDHHVFDYVLEMEIDEERTLCPFHKKKKKKKKKKVL